MDGFSKLCSSTLLWLWLRDLQMNSLSWKTNCIYILEKNFNANIVFVCTSITPDHFIELLPLSYKNGWISARVGVFQISSALQGSELVQAFTFSSTSHLWWYMWYKLTCQYNEAFD